MRPQVDQRRWSRRTAGSVVRGGAAALLLWLGLPVLGVSVPDPSRAQGPTRITLDFDEGDADTVTTGTAPQRPGEYRVRSNDMVRFGESVIVEANERIRGDVVVFGGTIRVRGYVDGDAVSVGGSVVIEDGGEVRGEAISVGGHVEEHGKGRLRGTSLALPGGTDWDDLRRSRRAHFGSSHNFVGALVWLVFLLLFGWLATRLAPARLAMVRERLREGPMSCFLWGLGAFVCFVPALLVVIFAVVLLCITIIGIPLGIALLLGYFVGFALLLVAGYLVGSSTLGAWLAPRVSRGGTAPSETRLMVFGILGGFGLVVLGKLLKSIWLAGALLDPLGGLIAVIGWIVSSLAVFLGTGALLSSGFGLASLRWVRRAPAGPSPASPPSSAAPPPAPQGPASPPPPALPAS